MREFILNILKLALLILIVASVCQGVISVRIKNKITNGHDNLFAIRDQKNDILFMGGSRCANHFIPKVFKDSLGINSVNLGTIGHSDIPFYILRLNYYLKYNPPPKYVVLSFDPTVIAGPLDYEKNTDFTSKHYFSRYAFFAQDDNSTIVKYFHYNFAEKYIPLYAILRYKMLLSCITLGGGNTWLKNGFLINNGIWDSTTYHVEKPDKEHAPEEEHAPEDAIPLFQKNYDSIKAQLQYFNNYCRENNIKLICIQTPVYKIEYNQLFQQPGKMCNELGITFIDSNVPQIINDVRNFIDPIHLNTDGAGVFCKYLCKNKEFLEAINK